MATDEAGGAIRRGEVDGVCAHGGWGGCGDWVPAGEGEEVGGHCSDRRWKDSMGSAEVLRVVRTFTEGDGGFGAECGTILARVPRICGLTDAPMHMIVYSSTTGERLCIHDVQST